MRHLWIAAVLAAAMLAAIIASHPSQAQSSGADDATAPVEYTNYDGASLSDFQSRQKVLNQPIALKDYYDVRPTRLPPEVIRGGVNLNTHEAFYTMMGTGSGLLCLVPKTDKESVEAVEKALRNDKLLIYGRIRRAGNLYVMMVDEVYRGWSKPRRKSILVTISDPAGKSKVVYRLSEPGKTHAIRSPYDGKPVHISFQFE
ncbi:MAG TPA: hypothetical protein P5137_03025 [Candidatus Brocadiia bacterium]|nr:hypothetical protein [Candidatus Brocadiia bacterium]